MRRPLALLTLAVVPLPLSAQRVPPSQHATLTQRVGQTDIAISYNRPVARGRELFGGIVPWGRVWHPGADSATTISFSADILVEGHELRAGRYTLWTIPQPSPEPWTVIFSKAVGVWHRPYPGDSLDVLRVPVASEQGGQMEVLAYYFPVVGPDTAVLRLHWGTTIVPVRLRTK